MTALYVTSAVLAGAAVGAFIAWQIHLRLAEEHHFRPYRVSEDTFRQLAAQADHDHRAAVRWENALDAFRELHDEIVGDLLDRVPTPRRPTGRSPIPDYGPRNR